MNKKNIADIYKLTAVQEGMLFHALNEPESSVYIEQFTRRAERPCAEQWQQAWDRVIEHYPILRSGFYWEGLEKPVQVVKKSSSFRITELDWSGDCADTQQAKLDEFLEQDRLRTFDFKQSQLMRQYLIHVSQSESYFVWTYHHILLDGWSAFIVIDEVFSAYQSISDGKAYIPRPGADFKSYVRWLEQQSPERAEHYWRSKLKDFSSPTPLGLVEQPDYASGDEDYRTEKITLERQFGLDVREFTKRHRLTLNTLFQGVWAYLLGIYSGNDDVMFGSTVSGRPTSIDGAESMVGLFINTLPTCIRIEPDTVVSEWLQAIQGGLLEMRDYEYSSLVEIQGWSDIGRAQPLFDSVLAMESFPSHVELSEVRVAQQTNYPLTIVVVPGQEIGIKIMFNACQFSPCTVERLLAQFELVLHQFVKKADQALASIVVCPETDWRQQAIWNDTAISFCADRPITTFFEQQVRQIPEQIAAVAGDERITYSQLDAKANHLARLLIAKGLRPGEDVAILLEPSIEMVVAIVAIVKAGCAYAPLDVKAPQARLQGMVSELQFSYLVSHRNLAEPLAGLCPNIVDMDQDHEMLAEQADSTPDVKHDTQSRIYVIHTSGSTGKPKAAGVFHHSFINLMTYWVGDFNFHAGDKVLLVNKVTFDLSQKNIWGALITGGQLHLYTHDYFEPERVRRQVTESAITWMNITPSMAYALVEQSDFKYSELSSLRYLFVGGEPVNKERLRGWILSEDFSGELVNTYGPTECTDLCATHRFTRDEFNLLSKPVTVGKALPNINLYVLDRHDNPLPPGVIGEVVIGGVSIGCGYLNNIAMTKEKFFPNPFSGKPDDRLYRTGDLGYFQEDGSIVVKGRVDYQVKIRGYRIELDEIDSYLQEHEWIQDCVTVVLESDRQLASYIVEKQICRVNSQDSDEFKRQIKEYLSSQLPEYMVPNIIVLLPSMPLNDNGKVNRGALPDPSKDDYILGERVLEPANHIEESLHKIWLKVLDRDVIGMTDSFFELGGHSLSITQVCSRIRKEFDLNVPLSELFQSPTIRQQAELILSLQNEDKKEIPRLLASKRPEHIPLSYAQSRLWFLHQYDADNLAYNVPNVIHFDGVISENTMLRAIQYLMARHESLRTYFPIAGVKPTQVIDVKVNPVFSCVDLRTQEPFCRDDELKKIATSEAKLIFNLQQGPLANYRLVQVDNDTAKLFVTMHHSITDGWSMDVFTRELTIVYQALLANQEPQLPELPIQYADYSLWQNEYLSGDVLEKQLAYMRDKLKGSVSTISLPYDFTRPDNRQFEGGIVRQQIPERVFKMAKQFSESQGVTLFMSLLTVFNTLLYRLSEQQDFNIGTPIANRHHQEIENVIGFFVNTLVLRCQINKGQSFLQLLDTVKQSTQSAYDHQDVPFELLVDELNTSRSASLQPFFQVMFVLQTAYEDTSLISQEDWVSRFDLQVTFSEENGQLQGSWEYDSSLFKRDTIERFCEIYSNLLESVFNEPDCLLDRLSLIPQQELLSFVNSWNQPATEYPSGCSIAELFEHQVALHPDRVALSCAVEQLSYSELNIRANQLAYYLLGIGVEENQLIGVSMRRGIDSVVAILGILKAGAAYVPMDPAYPAERLAYIAKDSGVRLILVSGRSEAKWHGLDIELLDITTLPDAEAGNPSIVSTLPVRQRLAYMTYTSGTTGQPKGVLVPQVGVARLVKDINYCPLNTDTVMLHSAPLAFDASTFELWGGLLNGGQLVIYDEDIIDIPRLAALIKDKKVNTAWLTSGLFNHWMQQNSNQETGLSYLIVGGEVIAPQTVSRLYDMDSQVQCINGYGPTENTTFTACYPIGRDFDFSRSIPIGKAIRNTSTYVLDGNLVPVPVGVVGELYVGGDGLALGYHNHPELTAEKYISNPFTPGENEKMYKTGDYVRLMADGNLQYVGRSDSQVKIRGFRIELDEVMIVLDQHSSINQSLVITDDNEVFGKHMLAYFTVVEGASLDVAKLRKYMQAKLPDYMVPSHFIALKAFELNANGKIDRSKLPKPGDLPTESEGVVPPATELEKQLWQIWSEVLQQDAFGIESDFFGLGGHSLLAAQLSAMVGERLSIKLPLKTFFEEPTIAGICRYIDVINWAASSVEAGHNEGCEEVGVL